MNPFFFGDTATPLYGVFHPAASTPKSEGILLCAPFGQEYMRSHRAFRQLAMLLSKKGYPVLRFDYRGTGDSYGDSEDATIAGWIEDIGLAAEELKHSAHIEKISVVGLRLGGLLATKAVEKLVNAESLILWDTIISGSKYYAELKGEIDESPDSLSKLIDADGTLHFNGFPLYKSQLEELEKIDLCEMTPNTQRIVQICSEENANQTLLKESWGKLDQHQFKHIPAPGDWNFVDDFGGILLPQQIIQAIVNCFE